VSRIRFEWDEVKNRSNQRKHGIAFREASQVFLDPLHVTVFDGIESGEERWRTFGLVEHSMVIVVAHTFRELDGEGEGMDIVRIISARVTTKKEKLFYEEENG
jgi:uncharacterized DUF497 family protein